ncbi:MAG: MFS transporter [Alphaproteobacteria bacterium]|nr:MFS transporter [Alphaproteobacteria bacterium]
MFTRNLLLFLGGRLAGNIAMQVQSAAVAWQLWRLTEDPLMLGFVGLAQFVPMFAFTLYAGDIADRFERRRILAASYIVEGICAAIFLGLTLNGTTDVWPFFATLVLFGTARAFSAPASQSFLPQIVPLEDLPRAISVSSTVFQIAVIAGPALGGAALLAGPAAAYGICLTLFLVTAAAVYAITLIKREVAPIGGTLLQRVVEGIAYVRRRREIMGAITLDLFAVLLGGAAALIPIFATEILHVGPLGFGFLKAAPAIGAAVMSVALTMRPLDRNAGMKMFLCVAVFGLATVVFGLSENFYLSFAALITMGAADMVSVNVRHSLTQLATPDHMRGRVSAVNMLFIGASNELGEFESGVTAAWWGAVPAVIVGGLGTLAVVGMGAYVFPELRKIDRLSDLKPE